MSIVKSEELSVKIVKDLDITHFNAGDWNRMYDMENYYYEMLQSWDYETMQKFNRYVANNAVDGELNERFNDLENLIMDFIYAEEE